MFETRIVRQSNVRALYASLLIHIAMIGTLSRMTFNGTTKPTKVQVVYAADSDLVTLPSDMIFEPVSRSENKPTMPNRSFVPSVERNEPPVTPAQIPPDIAAFMETGFTANVSQGPAEATSITGALIAEGAVAQPNFPEPIPPAPPPATAAHADPADSGSPPVRIGGQLEIARIIKQAAPVYPRLARTARVQGVVVIDAVITESGLLGDITVVSGHPLLVDAAIDCVRHWRYKAARLNGIPVKAPVHIEVNFKLDFQQ